MKANELMIGDWVRKLEPGGHTIPVKVTGIIDEDNSVLFERRDGVHGVTDIKAFSPIPLTAEILEKNGYHYEETCGIKQLYSEDGRVSFTSDPNYLNSQNVWSMHIDSVDMSTIGGIELTYVHEFQHMLRLCGIDKDINL